MILTSASRSGGEVRITEAERLGHVYPGRRGAKRESRRAVPAPAGAALYGRCAAVAWGLYGAG